MAKWKLTRQQFGAEEFTLSEGDTVTVGRGNNNKITLSSAVISRNHCVIHVHNNRALLTDLQVPATLCFYIINVILISLCLLCKKTPYLSLK